MEVIRTSSQFRWGYEETPGTAYIPPTDDELVDYVDEGGEPILDEEGNPVRIPKPDWEPRQEQVTLNTIVIVEQNQSGGNEVFKFALDDDGLSRFLTYYVQFLDVDGRNLLRKTLNETSDIVVPTPVEVPKLTRVK